MAFKVTAKAIVPKGWNTQKMQLFIKQALHEEGKRDQKEFKKTTDGWHSAPSMRYSTSLKEKSAEVWIGPSGSPEMVEKWRRIDEGTPSRTWTSQGLMIFPFQGRGKSYNPKTRAGWFGSVRGAGQKFGPVTRTHTIKDHSIEARNWSRTLAAQRIGPFSRNIQAAINRGLK